MMKILMTGLLPVNLAEVRGGVVSVILNLLDGFAELKDVEILHLSFNSDIDNPISVRYKSNINIFYIPFKSKYALVDYYLNRNVLKEIIEKEKPDLIHIEEITPQLIRFAHLDRKKIIVTQHGIMKEDLKNAKTIVDWFKKSFKALVELILYPTFTNLIFISNYNARLFRGTPTHSERIFNPVNPVFLDTEVSLGKLNSILFVAVISERKNLQLLLCALGELRKMGLIFELNVAGGFKSESFRNRINDLVRELNLGDQVNWHGWRTQAEILEMHRQSSILVLPSMQESMPVAIAEAMSTGRVVVASDVGGVAEMITHGETGFLFPSNNQEKLVSILKELHQNEELIKQISSKAKAMAKQSFHPKIVATLTRDFYQKVKTAIV